MIEDLRTDEGKCTHCGRPFTPEEPRRFLVANPLFMSCLDEKACRRRLKDAEPIITMQEGLKRSGYVEPSVETLRDAAIPKDTASEYYLYERLEEVKDERDQYLNDLAKYGTHHLNCTWHDTPLVGVDCSCGLREALGQPSRQPTMFECDCGNRYNSEFFNAKTFNCFCCGKELVGP